jgi:hypothetical protein
MPRTAAQVAITLALSTFSLIAVADDSRLNAARQLVQLLRYGAQIVDALEQCKQSTRTALTPESIVQAEPSFFGGITPSSKYWPEVAEAFRRYYDEACSYMDADHFLYVTARAYATALSDEQLAQSIAFYSSPTGQSLAKANVGASSQFQKEAGARMPETTKVAYAKFIQRVREIVEKCRCEQK